MRYEGWRSRRNDLPDAGAFMPLRRAAVVGPCFSTGPETVAPLTIPLLPPAAEGGGRGAGGAEQTTRVSQWTRAEARA